MPATSANFLLNKLDQSSSASDASSSSCNNGWRIMEKMGYVSGVGLGKNEDGCLEPFIPKQLPRKNISVDNFAELTDQMEKNNRPINKIIDFLIKKGLIPMLSVSNMSKLMTVIEENPPNFDLPLQYEGENYKSVRIPGIKIALTLDYLKNLIDFLLSQKLIARINGSHRRSFKKLIANRTSKEERQKKKEDKKKLDAKVATLAGKFSSLAVKPATMATTNFHMNDNRSIPHGIIDKKSHSLDVISISSEDSSHEEDSVHRSDVLIRNFSETKRKYEEITMEQFWVLRKLLDLDISEKISNHQSPVSDIPKIDRFERLSKFCCLVVCSDRPSVCWLLQKIENHRISLTNSNFKPKISIIDQKSRQNFVILRLPGANCDPTLNIEYLDRQNSDLAIKSWRFLGRHTSKIDQFCRLYFVIDQDRLFSKLKKRHFQLRFKLGEISAQDIYFVDDILNEPDFLKFDQSMPITGKIARSDYKLSGTCTRQNGNQSKSVQGHLKLKIEKFSQFSGDLASDSCLVANLNWNILVKKEEEKIGFFLQCKNVDSGSEWSHHVKGSLEIPSRKTHLSSIRRSIDQVYSTEKNIQGFADFIEYQKLIDPQNGFIFDDNVVFVACFTISDAGNSKTAAEQESQEDEISILEPKIAENNEKVIEKEEIAEISKALLDAQKPLLENQNIEISNKISEMCRKVISDENSPIAVVICGLKGENPQESCQNCYLMLKECLRNAVQNFDVSFIPRFVQTAQYSNDQLMIICSDRSSFDWLEKMANQVIKLDFPLIKLSLLTSKMECKISFSIPNAESETFDQVMDLLKNQNQRLSIDQWNFVSTTTFYDQNQRRKTKFTFEIDSRSIQHLILANFRLFYAFNQVFVEIVENTGI